MSEFTLRNYELPGYNRPTPSPVLVFVGLAAIAIGMALTTLGNIWITVVVWLVVAAIVGYIVYTEYFRMMEQEETQDNLYRGECLELISHIKRDFDEAQKTNPELELKVQENLNSDRCELTFVDGKETQTLLIRLS